MDTQALRQKILDLAIRGKLVPQDPNDEPASVLLERIRAEKQQMVKDGKLKAKDIKADTIIFKGEDNLHYEKFQDGTIKCIEDEIPFDVPEGWAWTRLSIAASVFGRIGYRGYKKSDLVESGQGAITLSPSNIKNNSMVYDSCSYISWEKYEESPEIQAFPGDILLVKTGSSYGKTAIIKDLPEKATINPQFVVLKNIRIDSEYLCYFLQTSYALDRFESFVVGAAIPTFSQASLNAMLIPIPTEKEQHRICEKINYSCEQTSTINLKQDYIFALTNSCKTKILDLAIRGKLVPQDPSDEPASVLLERIRAEKEALIKQGKIKRDKNDSVIYKGDDNSYYLKFAKRQEYLSDHLLFDLPHGWRWCTLYEIAKIDLGKTLNKAKNTGKLYPYLRSVNVRWNSIDLSDIKEMRFEKKELERYTISKNDLLICEGGDVGRCCVWIEDSSIQYQNALHRVKLFQNCNPYYFMYYLMCYESKDQLKRMCAGVTIKHFTGDVLSKIPFALPPISEQNRIVEAVEKAFSYLDQISESLS